MFWKEHKPPAECTENGSTKTCSIVTNHFSLYTLAYKKVVTVIMPAAVAAIVAAMLAVAWSGGTTEIAAISAAVALIVAVMWSDVWSGATTPAVAMHKSLPGSPVSF